MTINKDTPIAMLTVGQLQQVLEELKNPDNNKVSEPDKAPTKYVYGIAGIRKLFGVSHVTAQRYKDGILRDAVSQRGRVIVTDVEKAMELFKNNQQ